MDILLNEFDPMLKATKVVPNLEHEVSKFIKLLPVTLHNKIVKLCVNNEGVTIKSYKLNNNDVFIKNGFRYVDEKNLYDVTVSKKNNKFEELTIFKEELKNKDNYSSLEIKHYTKEDIQNLNENALTFCSFTKYSEINENVFEELTYDFKIKKEEGKYFVFVECENENELQEEYNSKYSFNKSYEVKLENIFEEAHLER